MEIHWTDNFEDNPTVLMNRVVGESGANLTQALVNAINYRVFEYGSEYNLINDVTGTEIGVSAGLTVASVVFDTLQTDTRWSSNGGDATGYNFRFTLPAARLPSAAKFYRVEVTFDPATAGEENFVIVWGVKTLAVKGT